MEILFSTTELAPYAKVGGLADVAAALPKAMRALGHRVTIVLPRYPALEAGGLLVARRLTPLRFTLGDKSYEVTVFDGRLASQIDLVLIDAPGLFDRGGVYGDRGEDYPDNARRFAVLSRAIAEVAVQRGAGGQPFDVIVCNDWPTALVPTFLRQLSQSVPKTMLVLHNVAHQGVFPKETLPDIGLGWDAFTPDGIEFFGKVNVLKLGIATADVVVTVSPTYAREIQSEGGGFGLEGVLRSRGRSLIGITNGIDYGVWNPATDHALATRYDAEDSAQKMRCKGALQKELGLALEPHVPVIVAVGRMVPQKGTDLLATALPKILRGCDAQVVIAGDGEAHLIKAIETAIADFTGRAVFVRAAPEAVVHRMFSAADLALVPSRHEPCGLVQLYAQRYGAVPVARATGGLVDTIVDCDANLETGTGFLFEEASADALAATTLRAISSMGHERWPTLVRRVMRLDRSWDGPARRYEALMK